MMIRRRGARFSSAARVVRRSTGVPGALLALIVSACAPTLNWREFTAEGTGVTTTFPCRPDRHERSVDLSGRAVRMEMLVCEAGDATYALSFFDAPGATDVGPGLAALRAALLANLQSATARDAPAQVRGMTPHVEAARVSVGGRRPGGGGVHAEAAFFAKGTRIYQAAVIGARLSEDAVEPFFTGLRLPGG